MSFRVLLSPPELSGDEHAYVARALDSGWLAPVGPDLNAFEGELARACGVSRAVGLASGTAALHLALKLAGVGPGDTVWVPSLTFVATANAVRYCGAEPVFFDNDLATWTLCPDLVEEALADGAPPKAIVAVDLFGQCADYSRLGPLCQAHGIALIEDAAESLGARHRGQPAGSFGDAAALSFNGNKIITCSGGGALVTNRGSWAERTQYLATQARAPRVEYHHEDVGYNYRLSNILAAVGRAQLADLRRRVSKRRTIFAHYYERLSHLEGVSFQPEPEDDSSTRWLTAMTLDPTRGAPSPDQVRQVLAEAGIESRPIWKPLHLQPVYRDSRYVGPARNAEWLYQNGLCLPSGSSLTASLVDEISACISSCFGQSARAAQ